MIRDIQDGKVFSVDKHTKTIMAEVQSAGGMRQYECALLCCDNPLCLCGTVHLSFTPRDHAALDDPASPYLVDFDVMHRKLAYEDEGKVSEENLAFAKSLLSNLDETDYEFLLYSHFTYKNEITEKAGIETIEADFDYQDIEENGALYAYNDVLPYGDPLQVRMQGESCLIYDQYCLQPKCTCTDTTLTFFPDKGLDKPIQELFAVRLDYKTKRWTAAEGNAGSVDIGAVRSALVDQIPDIYKRLLQRHIKLKAIYAHCKKRHFKPRAQVPKVGRNDPCPCGSGKKYKKCCM